MEQKELTISYKIYQSISELELQDKDLLEKAVLASKSAYAPYSSFNVGAAILLDNGEIVMGNNQENAAYPSGLCAERVAMFSASSRYPDAAMLTMAITANTGKFLIDKPVSPCGACRQVMSEYENRQKTPMRIILMGTSGEVQILDKISDLMPFMFHGDELKLK